MGCVSKSGNNLPVIIDELDRQPRLACKQTGSQTDRQSNREAVKQTGSQTDRQSNRQAVKQTGSQTDRQSNR